MNESRKKMNSSRFEMFPIQNLAIAIRLDNVFFFR